MDVCACAVLSWIQFKYGISVAGVVVGQKLYCTQLIPSIGHHQISTATEYSRAQFGSVCAMQSIILSSKVVVIKSK